MQSHPLRLLWSLCLVSQLFLVSTFASSSGGYGGNSLMGGYSSGGSGGSSGYGGGSNYGSGSKGPVTAAVETSRTVEVKPVQSTNEPHEPHIVEVPADDSPVIVHFKSQSSRVLVQQTHTPAEIGEPEHTSSEDEPQRVIHEVVKPVIQEIREVIQPYRRLIQQIQPVLETTHTIIAKGEPRQNVDPIQVPGASSGTLSGGSGGGGGKSSSSYGSSGNYAASASSVSLKSAPSTSSEPARSNPVSPQSTNYKSSAPAVHQSNPAAGRKFSSAQIQQIFQQSSPASQYSARRGDLREAQPTQTRINLRPAPVGYNSYYRQPVVQAVKAIAAQPVQAQPTYAYGYSDYQGAVSALHEDDLPLLTFVAKPSRFRARARA